jgi:hypothetical protein
MLAVIQSRTSCWKASSSALKARSISLRQSYRPSMTFDMMPRCTSDEPP